MKTHIDLVLSLREFLDKSPTAFQAADSARGILDEAGYNELEESEQWDLEPARRYLLVRNDTTVVAFTTPPVAAAGFRIATAHTDSPGLKIKPLSESVKNGSLRITAEVYGGPIYHTWLDRELTLAGSVVTRTENGLKRRLFAGSEPLAIIPSPAIHLNRDVNKGFEFNPQDHLRAVFTARDTDEDADGMFVRRYVGGRIGVAPDDVVDYDLYLCDLAKAAIVGRNGDMIVSGRLDNLAMCHAALTAQISAKSSAFGTLAVLFDSEEIGSRTYQGAASSLLRDCVERIVIGLGGNREDCYRALSRSAMISGDAAHGVHPNFTDKHDEHYMPKLNGGPVIKANAGQRYTTTAFSASIYEEICRERKVPVQRIVSRSDKPSGGTVGPIVSSQLGIPSLDVGHPIWGMHSIRETGGVSDHNWVVDSLAGFFESEVSWR